jgi:DNA-binding FadR family transcriptional regulator
MPTKKRPKRLLSQEDRPLRLNGAIARDLGLSILSGRHAPGELLDNQIEASGRLGVSRGAYREAVRILAAKGLVSPRTKTGTRVNPPGDWHLLDPDVLSWLFEFDPDKKLVEDLFELRKTVEPQAAALAASRRTDEELLIMRAALLRMEKHNLTTEEGRLADREFHATLLAATRNAFLISLTSGIAAAVDWTTIFKQRNGTLHRDSLPDHRRVYEGIAAGDAKAAGEAMHRLLDLALFDTTDKRRSRRSSSR